jgi:rubrerythrin
MDEQGKLLAKVNHRATEARSADVAAQEQTNLKLYRELIAKTGDDKIIDVTADLINRICER